LSKIIIQLESFAEKVKRLRKEKAVPLRVVSAHIDIDQAILSKIENGKRNATRENVIKLARYYDANEKEMVVSWLSDKILYEVGKEELALEAIKVAEEKIAYNNTPQLSKEKI
jgi:HTH-type transcriptional regulator, competence development regulator